MGSAPREVALIGDETGVTQWVPSALVPTVVAALDSALDLVGESLLAPVDRVGVTAVLSSGGSPDPTRATLTVEGPPVDSGEPRPAFAVVLDGRGHAVGVATVSPMHHIELPLEDGLSEMLTGAVRRAQASAGMTAEVPAVLRRPTLTAIPDAPRRLGPGSPEGPIHRAG